MIWTTEARRELGEWLRARWPDSRAWDTDVWKAFLDDLDPYNPTAVQRALEKLRDDGLAMAPKVSQVIAALRRQKAAAPPAVKDLPPLPGAISWREYSQLRYGRYISWAQAAREHREDA